MMTYFAVFAQSLKITPSMLSTKIAFPHIFMETMQQHNLTSTSTSSSQPQSTAALHAQSNSSEQVVEASTNVSMEQPKPKDEAQLTDEQILTQMQAIKDEEANAHPLVDSSIDLLELEAEYANGSVSFRNKIRVRK